MSVRDAHKARKDARRGEAHTVFTRSARQETSGHLSTGMSAILDAPAGREKGAHLQHEQFRSAGTYVRARARFIFISIFQVLLAMSEPLTEKSPCVPPLCYA